MTTLPRIALLAAVALLAGATAHAQTGQSVTQPSANLNQSQTLTNQSQQPPNVSGPGAVVRGQQMDRPSANLNESQALQNQRQNSQAGGALGGTTGTGPSR